MSRFKMKFMRPRLGVGTKTWIGFSIVFWLPVLTLLVTLFFLFNSVFKDEALALTGNYLQSTEDLLQSRAELVKKQFALYADNNSTRALFEKKSPRELHGMLLDFTRINPNVDLVFAVDEKQRIISNRNGKGGGLLNIGDALPKSILTGHQAVSLELMSNSFIAIEDEELHKHISSSNALIQFIIQPVMTFQGKVQGALVAGILLTGDPWLPNSVYERYGVEVTVFAGERPEIFRLHSYTSMPHTTWEQNIELPSVVKKEITFGRSFADEVENREGKTVFAMFKPLRDSKERIIGSIGISLSRTKTMLKVTKPLLIAAAITAVVGFIIAIMITLLVRHDITSPIRLLQEAMDSLGRGETAVTVELATGDEFESLGDGFNKMASGILQREERLRKHYEVTKLLMSTLNLDDLLQKMLHIVAEVTGSQMGIVYLVSRADLTLIPGAKYGVKSDIGKLALDEGYPGLAVSEKRQILVKPETGTGDEIDYGFSRALPAQLAYIPLVYNESVMGILVLGSVREYDQEEIMLFDYLANQIAVALDNAILHKRVHELSITDNLTGLYNRHFLNKRLEELWSKSARHREPLAMLLADLDNFKSINDTFGHKCGDDILEATGKIFRNTLRKEDTVARYGGEEFVAVMENTTVGQAREMAERIRKQVHEIWFDWMEKPVTVSIGIAVWPDSDSQDSVQLTQAADEAMYYSKTTGKNRVTVYSPKN